MSNDEEDYMSDAFLAKCADKKPGLLSRNTANGYKKAEKHRKTCLKYNTKPIRQLEREKREEGLSNALDSSNKGFALLQKMGYKPGMSLGKKGSGRIEPVPILLKTGRGGIGRDGEMKRRQEQSTMMRRAMAVKRARHEETHRHEFRSRFSEKMSDKDLEQDLYKSQKVCQHLDADASVKDPIKKFYWPTPKVIPKDSEEDKEEEEEEEPEEEEVECLTAEEMLTELTSYLRGTYLYCVWCGTRFDDKVDIEANCPGNTAQAHE